jgi:hypothetical protein
MEEYFIDFSTPVTCLRKRRTLIFDRQSVKILILFGLIGWWDNEL